MNHDPWKFGTRLISCEPLKYCSRPSGSAFKKNPVRYELNQIDRAVYKSVLSLRIHHNSVPSRVKACKGRSIDIFIIMTVGF